MERSVIRAYPAQRGTVDRQRFSRIENFGAIPDMVRATRFAFSVGDDEAADGLFDVLGGVPVQQGDGTRKPVGHEEVIPARCK